MFTGFPWLASGYAQVDGPFAGFAPVVGVYGVGWMLALVAALIVQALLALRCAAFARPRGATTPAAATSGRSGSNSARSSLARSAVPAASRWR